MQDAKPWYLSAGVWGAFVTLLGSGLSLLKFRLDPALLDDLRDWVLSLVTLLGSAVALYGRIRATRRLVMSAPPTDPAAKGQNWRMNAAGPLALLILPAALLAHASGCASLASPSASRRPPARSAPRPPASVIACASRSASSRELFACRTTA